MHSSPPRLSRAEAHEALRSARLRAPVRSARWLGRTALGGGALLLGLLACEGDDRTPPPRPTPQVERLAGGFCDLAFRCCDRGEVNFLLGPYVDEDDCEGRLLNASLLSSATFELSTFAGPSIALPNLGALERAVSEGRVAVDEAAMQECLDYLSALECAKPSKDEPAAGLCEPPEPGLGSTPCDVHALFVGKVDAGEPCSSGLLALECRPGLACARDAELGVHGECVPIGQLDDPCFTSEECGLHVHAGELAPGQHRREKLYCSQADGSCQLLRREGETCLYADRETLAPDPGTQLIRCAPGLGCDPLTNLCVAPCQRGAACVADANCDEEQELVCVMNRCDRPRGEGAPCAEHADCLEALRCGADLESQAVFVCQPRLGLGETCSGHGSCESEFCDPVTSRCKAQIKAGGVCPSGVSAECEMGLCANDFLSCSVDGDCPGSNSCDLVTAQCAFYCVALKPDGATCASNLECASAQCVAEFCRTPPLDDGVACGLDAQCDSGFCSLDPSPVCARLPLALGKPCSSSLQCASEVCFQDAGAPAPSCVTGLSEGEACGASGQPPCSPLTVYCDPEIAPAVCAPLKKTGEDCKSSVQCRGDCLVSFSRKMCFPPADPTAPLCSGAAGTGEGS